MPDRATMSALNFRLIFDIFFTVAILADAFGSVGHLPFVRVPQTMNIECRTVHGLAIGLDTLAVRTFISLLLIKISIIFLPFA
jgi:hypothetical protein